MNRVRRGKRPWRWASRCPCARDTSCGHSAAPAVSRLSRRGHLPPWVTSALTVKALSVGRADRRTSSGPGRNGPGSICCQLRWQSSTRPPQPGLDQQPRRRPHGALDAFSRGTARPSRVVCNPPRDHIHARGLNGDKSTTLVGSTLAVRRCTTTVPVSLSARRISCPAARRGRDPGRRRALARTRPRA